MRQFILFIFCCLSFNHLQAQTLTDFDLIKMEKASDYKPAEPFVLQTANYLLAVPFKKENKDRLNALRFIGKWMNGTPDYSFSFTDIAEKIGKENYDLIGQYMAALAKYTLENKAAAKDTKVARLNAMIMLLDYCENKDNNMHLSKQLKKLAEARSKGELEKSM
jgi:hypothetical protein